MWCPWIRAQLGSASKFALLTPRLNVRIMCSVYVVWRLSVYITCKNKTAKFFGHRDAHLECDTMHTRCMLLIQKFQTTCRYLNSLEHTGAAPLWVWMVHFDKHQELLMQLSQAAHLPRYPDKDWGCEAPLTCLQVLFRLKECCKINCGPFLEVWEWWAW